MNGNGPAIFQGLLPAERCKTPHNICQSGLETAVCGDQRLPSGNTCLSHNGDCDGVFHTIAHELGVVVQAARKAGDSSPSQSRARGRRRSRTLSTIITINSVSPNSGI